jgi:phage shock protein A
MITILIIIGIAIFAVTPVGKKAKTFVLSKLNTFFDKNTDPAEKLQLILTENKETISKLGIKYADIKADIDIINGKIPDLEIDKITLERKIRVAVDSNNKKDGTKYIAKLNAKQRVLDALAAQRDTLLESEKSLLDIKEKLVCQNDLAKAEITILTSQRDTAHDLKDLAINVAKLDIDTSEDVEVLKKQSLSNNYQLQDKMAELKLDEIDAKTQDEWDKLIAESKK